MFYIEFDKLYKSSCSFIITSAFSNLRTTAENFRANKLFRDYISRYNKGYKVCNAITRCIETGESQETLCIFNYSPEKEEEFIKDISYYARYYYQQPYAYYYNKKENQVRQLELSQGTYLRKAKLLGIFIYQFIDIWIERFVNKTYKVKIINPSSVNIS